MKKVELIKITKKHLSVSKHVAESKLDSLIQGHTFDHMEIGEEKEAGIEWPFSSDGLGHTKEDYVKYGTAWAFGLFRCVSE